MIIKLLSDLFRVLQIKRVVILLMMLFQVLWMNTPVVVLGTGDAMYEDAFRYYENKYKGNFCAYIAYNENVAHNIYAGMRCIISTIKI